MELQAEIVRLRQALEDTERRTAADAAALRTADVLERVGDGVCAIGADWRFAYVNRRAEQLWGRPRAELLGHDCREVFPQALGGEMERAFRLAAEERQTVEIETLSPIHHRWIELSIHPDEAGGLLVYVRDVDRRRRAEDALRERARRLQLLSDTAAGLLSATDPDEVLEPVFRSLSEEFGLDVSFSFVVEEGGEGLRLASCFGVPEEERAELARLEFGQAVCGTVAETRRVMHLSDVQNSTGPVAAVIRRLGVRAYACFPLVAGGRLFGTLSFGTRRRDSFPEEDIAFLGTIAQHTAAVRERLRAEAALREGRERLEAVVSHAGMGVCQIDLEGRFVLVNDRQCEILGRAREELLGGMRLPEVMHPDDRPKSDALLRRMIETGEPFAVEKRYIRPDGSSVWVSNHVSLTRDAAGGPRYVTALVQDVTARRAAEEERESLLRALDAERRRAEAERGRLATILDHLPVGVGIADTSGRIMLGNPMLRRFVGDTAPFVDPEAWDRWIGHHPDGRRIEPSEFATARALRGEAVVPGIELLYRAPDGWECWTRAAAVPVPATEGQGVAGVVILIVDIDERKRAERQRELLLAELNHRVKNILSTVQALSVQTLKGAGGDPAGFAQQFHARLRTLARAHDLLTERGWAPTDIEAVVLAALAPWLEGGGDRRFSLVIEGRAATVSPRQAQTLVLGLHELATNATKHGALSRPGGHVDIRCAPEEVAMPGTPGAATACGTVIEWTELGGPPLPGGPPTRRGFGTRLLERGLAQDLGPGAWVELRFEPDGLRAAIRFVPSGT